MQTKLVQKHLLRDTREFEIVDDTVQVQIKAPFKKDESLTVMLAVLPVFAYPYLGPRNSLLLAVLLPEDPATGESLLALALECFGRLDVVIANAFVKANDRVKRFLERLGDHEIVSMGSSLKLCLVAEGAADVYPRLGLSVEPDRYSEEITIVEGQPFTLYACVFGPDDATPLTQSLESISWVIHQVCCGNTVDIVEVEWSDDFVHEGHPILGVTSTPKDCVVRPNLLLATITAVLHDPHPNGGLWAAGPYDASYDCDGEVALFFGMPVSILVEQDTTPVEPTSFGGLKALYR